MVEREANGDLSTFPVVQGNKPVEKLDKPQAYDQPDRAKCYLSHQRGTIPSSRLDLDRLPAFLPAYSRKSSSISFSVDKDRSLVPKKRQHATLLRFRLRHFGNPGRFAKCLQLGCAAPFVCDQLFGERVNNKWMWNLRLCVSMRCKEGGYHQDCDPMCSLCLLARRCPENQLFNRRNM